MIKWLNFFAKTPHHCYFNANQEVSMPSLPTFIRITLAHSVNSIYSWKWRQWVVLNLSANRMSGSGGGQSMKQMVLKSSNSRMDFVFLSLQMFFEKLDKKQTSVYRSVGYLGDQVHTCSVGKQKSTKRLMAINYWVMQGSFPVIIQSVYYRPQTD